MSYSARELAQRAEYYPKLGVDEWNTNDVGVTGLLPALSDVKLYVTPAYSPFAKMEQHLSTNGSL